MNINDLIPVELQEAVATHGLDKIAAAMADVPVMDMPHAIGLIGAKAYFRRKEARSIADGLAAYAALTGAEAPARLTKIVTGR